MNFFRGGCLCFFLSLVLISCKSQNNTKIRIATAANMEFAIKALIEDFTERTAIECELVISSSGKLTAQIREGAPYDIFVAADMKYPEILYKDGLALGPPQVYAYGRLVLWTVGGQSAPAVEQLSGSEIRHIALANPRHAPYGRAAVQVLQHYGLWDELQDKLVYGESIAQTNHFITSGAAQVGFTALSVVRSPRIQETGKWILPDSQSYDPISQGAVVIPQEDTDSKRVLEFYNYLFSSESRKVLKDFGYLINE